MPVLGLSWWPIALACAWAFLILLCLLATIEVRLAVIRHDSPSLVKVEVRFLFLKLKRQFAVGRFMAERGRALVDRGLVRVRGGENPGDVGRGDAGEPSGETGDRLGMDSHLPPEPLDPVEDAAAHPDQTAADRSRIGLWYDLAVQARRAMSLPSRYLRRRVWCRRLMLHMELGTEDSMQTALLCGSAWAVAGNVLGLAGGLVRLMPEATDVRIQPNFQRKCLRVRVECILRFRAAHAIVAVAWFGIRFMREKGLVAWLRDRRFRKGVVRDDRPPDSGFDEDGYGDASDHGGRQYGDR